MIGVSEIRAETRAGLTLKARVDLVGRFLQWRAETLGEIDLEDIAAGDVVDDALDGAGVGGAREIAGDFGGQGPPAKAGSPRLIEAGFMGLDLTSSEAVIRKLSSVARSSATDAIVILKLEKRQA